jgi:8-oxo-dGTP pyrophosphatase MutT (NUDIX family)
MSSQQRLTRIAQQLVQGSSYQDIGEGGQTFWAGEGGGASGILPVCVKTKRLCLAWRSSQVHMGNCWGTIGGAIQRGMSPPESAIEEMREETGYGGRIELKDAYVFASGKFRYFNYLGLVDSEFSFNPEGGHSWETDYIKWMTYEQALKEIEGGKAHTGLKALFEQSKSLIEEAIGHEPETGHELKEEPKSEGEEHLLNGSRHAAVDRDRFRPGQKIQFWSERTMVPVKAFVLGIGRKYLKVRAFYTPEHVQEVNILPERVLES